MVGNNGWCSGGSVTCHANDRSAAGSVDSPPHCYALVCSGSKAAPTRCDEATLTDWQGKHTVMEDWTAEGKANCCRRYVKTHA